MKEMLKAGDTILDKAGYPVIRHWNAGYSEVYMSSREMYEKAINGEVDREEYASTLDNHVRIEMAYERDLPLPEGATIVPPTIEEVAERALMFTADLYYQAMKNARQGSC